jgi:anti-sigma regulatory factor (Ser/Thr protein kinase)
VVPYDRAGLASLRDAVRDLAVDAGVADERVESLVVAVSEIGTNSILHGGGHGVLRAWRSGRSLVCELHDAGWIADPLAGRRRPASRAVSGRGLWLANQFCDLVQLRTSPERGTTVRLHVVLDEQR